MKIIKIMYFHLKFQLCPESTNFQFYQIIIRKQDLIQRLSSNYFKKGMIFLNILPCFYIYFLIFIKPAQKFVCVNTFPKIYNKELGLIITLLLNYSLFNNFFKSTNCHHIFLSTSNYIYTLPYCLCCLLLSLPEWNKRSIKAESFVLF